MDLDELRTLLVTTTRKWENTGIPLECEIWEEEFLEKAGITREGAPRMRKEGDKSTEELAKEFVSSVQYKCSYSYFRIGLVHMSLQQR